MPELWGAGVRRPLAARSVIASTLLGVDPPRLPALALVRSGELFGLREGATRTALSRMAAAGEVEAHEGHYVLAGPLLDRHARQRLARRSATHRRWDGSWLLAVVTGERRPAGDRAAFRSAARRLGLAEVREGLWARPDDGRVDPGSPDGAVVRAQATWLRGGQPDDLDPFLEPFDLPGWSAVARGLVVEMQGALPALEARRSDVLAETFVVAAAVLRHLVADPALPGPLLPPAWPGDDLRATFERFDAAFKATWAAWYRSFRAE